MSLFYLYDDPREIAQALADRHVVGGGFAVAQIVSTTWWLLHSDWGLEMSAQSISGLFELVVPRAHLPMIGSAVHALQGFKDGNYRSGDRPFWLFCGQRVPTPHEPQSANVVWAQQRGGNYRWLHTLGMRILDEHKHRFGRYPKDARYLWALEPTPPALVSTEHEYEELPLAVPPKFYVNVGDARTTLDIWRDWYGAQGRLVYTNRKSPEWLKCL